MNDAPLASLDAALAHAARLLDRSPALAEAQAREILAVQPDDPRALMLLGAACRRKGEPAAARQVLAPLAEQQPNSPQTHIELGLALAALGETAPALEALRRAVAIRRKTPEAWRAIAEMLTLEGDADGADAAFSELTRASVSDLTLREAAEALCDDRLAVAEHLLRARLKAQPSDVAAMRMLAEAGIRLGRYGDAEALLTRCLELNPGFAAARYNLAVALNRQNKGAPALIHLDRLLTDNPHDASYRVLKAASLGLVGEYAAAIGIYQALLNEFPGHARTWLSLGHALRTEGRRAESVAAYKRAIALEPGLGDAYWSLANLKTELFDDAEVAAMEGQLARETVTGEDRFHLHYALGKALEDRRQYAEAFAHYAEGARLRRLEAPYDRAEVSSQVSRAIKFYTPSFFADRVGVGADSPEPIFIVGLPRSGSTLVEQILASHSEVEGTMELPEIGELARTFGRRRGKTDNPYPDVLATLPPSMFQEVGEAFLERTMIQRKRGAPHFIDKMPNNFLHLGFIHLILPNARIIDARRHPMAAGFSAFKQHFARGQAFSYDLSDIGRYYRDYLAMMDHFDAVLPGRVHRVIYEDMVADPEREVRALLAHCGLGFEAACLRFHDNPRAVRTASSEQVRRPIFREGLDHWRNFEPWLGPLAEALGPALDDWRGGR